MWNSIPALQNVASISLVVALVGGIVAAAAGAVGTWAGGRAADLQKIESDERVAKADLAAAQAQKQAALAGLKAERLRARMAWRSLRPEQVDILADSLKGITEISLDWVKTDKETEYYRRQLEVAFARASVRVMGFRGWESVVGTHIDGHPGPERDRLVSALNKAGIEIDIITDDSPHSTKIPIHLIIGSRKDGLVMAEYNK